MPRTIMLVLLTMLAGAAFALQEAPRSFRPSRGAEDRSREASGQRLSLCPQRASFALRRHRQRHSRDRSAIGGGRAALRRGDPKDKSGAHQVSRLQPPSRRPRLRRRCVRRRCHDRRASRRARSHTRGHPPAPHHFCRRDFTLSGRSGSSLDVPGTFRDGEQHHCSRSRARRRVHGGCRRRSRRSMAQHVRVQSTRVARCPRENGGARLRDSCTRARTDRKQRECRRIYRLHDGAHRGRSRRHRQRPDARSRCRNRWSSRSTRTGRATRSTST